MAHGHTGITVCCFLVSCGAGVVPLHWDHGDTLYVSVSVMRAMDGDVAVRMGSRHDTDTALGPTLCSDR